MSFRLLFTSFLCVFVLASTSAYGRKKSKRSRFDTGMAYVIEPDGMVARAMPESKVRPAVAMNVKPASSGHINTSYREGIDVSHYQERINWDQVAGGSRISYAYMKATEGATYVDDTYTYNLKEAKRVGLSVGSYHFYRPNVSPQQQFQNIKNNIRPEEQDLVPIIDIEHRGSVSETKFIADLAELIRLVENYYGKKPLLYSYQNFYNRHLLGKFKNYHWMIAKYDQSSQPVLKDGKDYIMWQYTSTGSIPGIKGNVDRSCLMHGFVLGQVGL